MNLALTEPPHARAGVKLVRAKDELRAALAAARADGGTVGLVPTMGYLHEGHVSLFRAARAECDLVVMSLFVNPAQFGAGEDLERYPRDEQRDAELAGEAGVDLIYAPTVEEVYPDGFSTTVEVAGVTEVLCGDPSRRGPQHFRGVTTVVAKLFNTVQPDVAYFGQKDAQQVAAIRRMVRDLDIPVRIKALPIVREADGLAMSSRNAYLSPAERQQATALSRALQVVERTACEISLEAGIDAGRRELERAGIEPEYLEARGAENLEPVAELDGRPVLIALAARVGAARLIDNVTIAADGGREERT
jgi:pantoate--beta-alanine ligase